MGGDFVQTGDVFNVEGQRYQVLEIDSPRSVVLCRLPLVCLPTNKHSRYRFAIDGGTVIWDKVASEWVVKGGHLERVEEKVQR